MTEEKPPDGTGIREDPSRGSGRSAGCLNRASLILSGLALLAAAIVVAGGVFAVGSLVLSSYNTEALFVGLLVAIALAIAGVALILGGALGGRSRHGEVPWWRK